MAYEKTKIRTVSNPTIVLQDMISGQKLASTAFNIEYNASSYIGRDYPYIKFKDRIIDQEEISSFEIDCTNFLPVLRLKMTMFDRKFLAEYLPKDGDIVSIYMRSQNKVYKPVRNDYLITNVDTNYLDGEGYITEYYITGILNVKNIWIERNTAFKGKSLDVIKKVANELQLGFATNIEGEMDDEMTWICDWKSYKDFLIHIATHSWKNEKTFYKIYIDIYYYVNFVEVEKQLDLTKEFDESLTILEKFGTFQQGNPITPMEEQPNFKSPISLTNFETLVNTNNGIISYELVNTSSQISYSEGYGKKIYYYDHYLKNITDLNQINFNPLYTEGTEASKIRLRGLKDEDIEKRHLKNSWYGIQYSLPQGNVHKHFAQAYYQNKVNSIELDKMYLNVETYTWNPSIIKTERLPLLIYEKGVYNQMNSFMSPEEKNIAKEEVALEYNSGRKTTLNRFFSGFYIVDGFILKYNPENGRNNCEYKLTRREWGVPRDTEAL